MQTFDPQAYGPAIAELLREPRLCPLGPGEPDGAARARLEALTPATVLAPHAVRDEAMARACCAGLWLYHDFLDESHRISQDIATPTGSYWHGILHRREPDASNAAYWFRRVGEHPVFEPLAREGQTFGLRTRANRWDPFEFIELCEKQRGTGSPEETTLRRVQQREWELLFDWCFRRAAGED
jgi:hypothetical protein